MKTYTVEYWIATYHGYVDVVADIDADEEEIIAKAKKQCYRNGHIGMAYEKFRIVWG